MTETSTQPASNIHARGSMDPHVANKLRELQNEILKLKRQTEDMQASGTRVPLAIEEQLHEIEKLVEELITPRLN